MPRTRRKLPPAAGPVTAYVSSTGAGHLDLKCSGLDRMRNLGYDPSQSLDPHEEPTLAEMFEHPDYVRPCRICALEPLLLELAAHQFTSRPRLFIVTGLGTRTATRRSHRPAHGADLERLAKIQDDAAARITRVARATGLEWVATAYGNVLYGSLNAELARTISRHVDVLLPYHSPRETCSAELVRGFWSLLHTTTLDPDQAWITARDVWVTPELVTA